MAPRKKPAKTPLARAKPSVILFCLRELTAAAPAFAALELPLGLLDAPAYVIAYAERGRATVHDVLPEAEIDAGVAKRAFLLIERVVEDLLSASVVATDAIGDGRTRLGFHVSASLDEVVACFAADGFNVLTLADVRGPDAKPRDAEVSLRNLARVAKSLARELDAASVAAVVRWLEEGGPEPEVLPAVVAPLASLVLDEAIETWGPVEERAFELAARRRVVAGFLMSPEGEGVGVDRWRLLSERLARAGWSEEEILDAWLDGIVGERGWASAAWFASALLPRLEPLVQRILARAERVDPAPALTRLLIAPLEDLPEELSPLYRAAVRRFLEGSEVARALGPSMWTRLLAADEAAFARASKKPRARVEPPAPARIGAPARLAEANARYHLAFPEEVLAVWDLASSLSPKDPSDAFAEEDDLGISLVGPFDLLAGRARVKRGLDTRLHYRFRFDPPEFLTVATGNVDGLHFGYWLDDPADGPACVASYYSNDAYEMDVPGRTLWEALRGALESTWAGILDNVGDDAKHASTYMRTLARLSLLRERMVLYATGDRKEIGEAYRAKYSLSGLRERQAIVMTPEGMGVVASTDRYRPLSLAGDALKKALAGKASRAKLVKEALGLAQEGFPASALLLGRHAWARGLDEESYALLAAAYAGLERPVLGELLALHRKHRDLAFVDVLMK